MARTRPIRLTYVITDLQVGGVPLHLYRLATRLPRDRYLVRVISLADQGAVGARLRQSGIPVHCCDARGTWDVRALWRLWKHLTRHPPDLVHSYLFHANLATRLICPAAGVSRDRLINEIQTVEIERPWHLVLDNLTCRWARVEVGNSRAVIDHLRRRAHIPASRLRHISAAVDLEQIERTPPASRSEFGIPDHAPLLIWVGRLDPVKGFEEMLAAMAIIAEQSQATLLLVGEGAYLENVKTLIHEHGLTQRVFLAGRRSNVYALLKMSDIFLLPSRTEGMPNALIEAMGAELPCVATDIPPCRELIVHDENGLFFRKGSHEDLAKAVLRLMRAPESARAMARRARQLVATRFDIRFLSSRWADFYESILAPLQR